MVQELLFITHAPLLQVYVHSPPSVQVPLVPPEDTITTSQLLMVSLEHGEGGGGGNAGADTTIPPLTVQFGTSTDSAIAFVESTQCWI